VPGLAPISDPPACTRTRVAWHQVAEHVLAPARYHAVGRIALRVVPGGFATPPFEADGTPTELGVKSRQLTIVRGEQRSTVPLTTIGEVARAAGVTPGAAPEVYRPSTTFDPDAPLPIDDDAARLLGAWFELGWAAIEALRATADADDAASEPALWPEHFDAAVDLGDGARGRRGTFGASPGDDAHTEPYLYVTHWTDVPHDPFWNDTAFGGASLGYAEVARASDPAAAARGFFAAGRARLNPG
jgi:hypothetical protein